jgi:hypothetical protein
MPPLPGTTSRKAEGLDVSLPSSPPDACVRRAEPADAPRLARLFQTVFRDGGQPPPALADYLGRLFLRPGEIESVVHVDAAGELDGFLGAVVTPMLFDGRPIRAAVTGCFMVESPARSPRAGRAMLRAIQAADLDFYLTDTANALTTRLATALGYKLLPRRSLEWIRPFAPARLAAHWAGRKRPLVKAALSLAAPLGDAMARRVLPAPARPDASGAVEREVDADAFVRATEPYLAAYRLRPDWSGQDVRAKLDLAAEKRANGRLRFFLVETSAGRPIGGYALYVERGLVSYLLHLLADAKGVETTLRRAVARARGEGALAIRGAAAPAWLPALYMIPGVIYRHNAATIIHAKDPAASAAALADEAFLGGLVGEGWTRLISDAF